VESANQIERVIVLVSDFLQALDKRSWHAFEACFARDATVSLSDVPEDPDDLLAWRYIRQGWRQVFTAELSHIGPVDSQGPRPIVELRGTTAFVSFPDSSRRQPQERAMILGLVEGRWLIRHLHVARLPLRPVAPVSATTSKAIAVGAGQQGWFVPVLVTALISIALLGALADRRSALQLSAAVLAVFFGVVTVLRGEYGLWLRGSRLLDAGVRNVPLTSSGALGVAVGAAFLVT
jgi:hypothetical protein